MCLDGDLDNQHQPSLSMGVIRYKYLIDPITEITVKDIINFKNTKTAIWFLFAILLAFIHKTST